MIDQENFERIINDMQSHVFASPNDVEKLVLSLMEMDQHLVIAQSALDFTLEASQQLMREVAEACIKVIGIRDAAKKRRLAKIAGEAAGRLAGAVQLHIAGQIMESQKVVSESLESGEES
jgi:hypothetical protein